MRRHFEGGGISRCGEISRKYGMSLLASNKLERTDKATVTYD